MADVEYSAPSASGLAKDSVFELAESVAEQLGYTPGSPLEPIVSKLGGRIQYQDFWQLESSASGSIRIHGEGNFDIYLAAHTGPARDRFTIGHELGHYIIHYLWPLKQGTQVGPIQAQRYGSGRVEWEANWFAAGLLMPKEAFTKEFKATEGDLIAVADIFGVSESAAAVRARALGLTD